MKTKLFLLIMSALSITICEGQNVKSGSYSFKYEALPQFPLPSEYKNYTIEAYSGATDGVPLSSKFIYLKEKYIDGLENTTNISTQQGVMIGGKTSGGGKETAPTNSNPDYKITVIMMNLEVMDKQEYINKTTNFQTNAIQDYYDYKMTFKFPYKLIVRDMKLNKTVIDTIMNNPKTTLFPADYRYNSFGDKIEYNGDPNKVELDLDFNNNANSIYQLSKQTLAKNVMNEVKSYLNSLYGYNYSQQYIMLYWVKSKDKLFDVSDTVLNNFKTILDSIDYNTKRNKHVNWHTSSIKNIARKTIPMVEKMIVEPRYVNAFENADREDYMIKMKGNLVILFMFTDELEKAQKLLAEIEPLTQNKIYGNYTINAFKALIAREIKLYNKHKLFFGFN